MFKHISMKILKILVPYSSTKWIMADKTGIQKGLDINEKKLIFLKRVNTSHALFTSYIKLINNNF